MRTAARYLVAAAVSLSCSRSEVQHEPHEEPHVIPELPDSAFDFDEVDGPSRALACSPKVDSHEFRGLLINAPKRVLFGPDTGDPRFGGFARFIICGVSRFDWNEFGGRAADTSPILIVAVNARTHEAYVGRVGSWLNGFVPKVPRQPGDEKRHVVTGGWFTRNLTRILPIPEQEADYHVYATIGDYKSNVVTIELRAKKP